MAAQTPHCAFTIRRHVSWQLQLAFVPAAREGVGQALVHVSAATRDAFVFPGAAGRRVCVFLEVRALLPGNGLLISALKMSIE
jgi:hypothetical protein